jgi:predicted transcriptional regulator
LAKINLEEFLKRKTLITGDVATGKTKLTAFIVKEMIKEGMDKEITIIDMAPERKGKVGGKIKDFINVEKIRYLTCDILGPRLNAKNIEDLYRIAEMNKRNIDSLIEIYEKEPTKILIINDLTIYLHRGNVEKLLKIIDTSETFIGNAYKGKFFQNGIYKDFNERERKLLEIVEKIMNSVIHLF